MSASLQQQITEWAAKPADAFNPEAFRPVFDTFLETLNAGEIRSASRQNDGTW